MDPIQELLDLLKAANLRPCFWFGLPDCPKCGGHHGDPACSEDQDLALRIVLAGQNDSGSVDTTY